jgi:hypothetical protein
MGSLHMEDLELQYTEKYIIGKVRTFWAMLIYSQHGFSNRLNFRFS